MVRRKASRKGFIVYLDTHIVLWLYDALVERLSPAAVAAINDNAVCISQFVTLELQFLFEIGHIRAVPPLIVATLQRSIGLKLSNVPLAEIVTAAIALGSTRDVSTGCLRPRPW
jgi:PIN domain nuclease of toxin-antitoxin system